MILSVPPWVVFYFSVQNLSLKYFSPESQRMVTITTSFSFPEFKPLRDFQAGEDSGRGGDPQEQAAVTAYAAGHGIGIFGRDLDVRIRKLRIVNLGHDGGGHVLAPSMPWKDESGWSEMQRIVGLSSRRRRVVPMNVPLVPSMATK